MKALLDACVLYPTVLRELVLGHAGQGGFTPLWSARILEEWRRTAARTGPGDERIAAAEIAALRARFPASEVAAGPATLARLHLPDPGDVHVFAAAVDGGADEILTLNSRDFPTNALAAEGLLRRHPDEFLLEAYHADPDGFSAVVRDVLARAGAHGIDVSNPRAVLRRARLPRLGRAVAQV